MEARIMKSSRGSFAYCAAALLCLTVAGCGNMMGKSDTSGSSDSGATGSSPDRQDNMQERKPGTRPDARPDVKQDMRQDDTRGNSAMLNDGAGAPIAAMPMDARGGSHPNWRATVRAIEPLSRQEAGMGIGLGGSPAAAAVGGTVPGMGTAGNTVYRVTLRGEDGSSHSVVVENVPAYKVGDQVTVSNGMIKLE